MKYKLLGALAVLVVHGGDVLAEQTDDAVFFQHNSQNTFNALFGLPVPASRMVQNIEWQFSFEHSNQFAGGQVSNEALVLDGESSLFTLRHKQRIAACWQAEASLPLIAHNDGIFDEAIDSWHQALNLPDADRDANKFDELEYRYAINGEIKQNIDAPRSGIGDVQLSVQRALGCFATADSTKAEAIVRLGLKLPTGNANELRGSGGADYFADWQSGIKSVGSRWYLASSLGALFLGDADNTPAQKRAAVYGSVGMQYVLSHSWRLIAQIDGHSAFYKSALRELGDPAVSLAAGFRYLGGRSYTFEFSVSEDAAIDTTPDIVARLALSYRPSLVN